MFEKLLNFEKFHEAGYESSDDIQYVIRLYKVNNLMVWRNLITLLIKIKIERIITNDYILNLCDWFKEDKH